MLAKGEAGMICYAYDILILSSLDDFLSDMDNLKDFNAVDCQYIILQVERVADDAVFILQSFQYTNISDRFSTADTHYVLCKRKPKPN
jgi:hypothetical protein